MSPTFYLLDMHQQQYSNLQTDVFYPYFSRILLFILLGDAIRFDVPPPSVISSLCPQVGWSKQGVCLMLLR